MSLYARRLITAHLHKYTVKEYNILNKARTINAAGFCIYIGPDEQPDHVAALPFYLIHVIAFSGIYWITVEAEHPWHYVLLIGALYYIRMFAITAFMHRYFAHNTLRKVSE